MAEDEYDPKDLVHLQGLEPKQRTTHPESVTCLRCGWVSFAVTKAEAEREIAEFNAYFASLPEEQKARYTGPSSLDQYRCIGCEGSEFRQARDGDCPDGVTLNPVVCDELAGRTVH
jgi:hypothetical protein